MTPRRELEARLGWNSCLRKGRTQETFDVRKIDVFLTDINTNTYMIEGIGSLW
jgi:hypothetical protein